MLVARTKHRTDRPPRAVGSASELLQNVLGSLGDAVILCDCSDRVVLFNHAAEQLTGVSEAQAVQRACADVFARTPIIAAVVARTRASGQGESCGEEALIVNGRRIPVRLSCSPVFARGDVMEGTAVVIQDLSYQKKLEDEAHRNETLARLGGLVAGLAHEVRNPLSGIKGAAQLLARRFGDQAEVAEYTAVMIREIDRLSQFVEQLLTLGAAPAPQLLPLNIHKVIHEVLALLASDLAARRVAVRLEIDPSLPDIRGDEAQLTHVFLNLVKNAVEAMPIPGALTVTTRMETDFHILRRAAGPGKFLRVELSDNGPGFAAEVVDRVFEPLFTTKPRGSGLGLAICQRMLAAHGGDIRADNGRSGGALVTVTLPIAG